ncbi:hypothetical protein [Nonomuraea endophytica]|uniref:Uncharacterized protein n=1 Tax=Nonomuraea endophytica TaxID=714136 RepID=A0A7W8A5W8_9ACTN|nr:hypothetical protein [Nonomuraea endophytica]MBB5080177.1 hypothetical protein [Nonomuraea endophytica]
MTTASLTPTTRRTPLAVTISAWAVPVMVIGQFAMLAIIPVVIALVGAFRHTRDRLVRWTAAVVAASWTIPFVIWQVRPDGAPSMSKDIHPGFVALIVAASAAFIVAVFRARRG